MELFMFTNRETHDAYQHLSNNSERMQEVVAGSRGATAQLSGYLEEWLIEERPYIDNSFYDTLMESSLLKIDFENLANAVLKTMMHEGKLIAYSNSEV